MPIIATSIYQSHIFQRGGHHMTRGILVGLLCLVVVVGVFAQTPLPPPTNLAAVQINDFGPKVRLTWDAPDSILSFRVYRSANDTNHFQLIGPNSMSTGRTFIDAMVSVGTHYFYYVKSARGNVLSVRSNVADIVIVAPPPPVRHTGTINGTVIDDSTNLPIPHVMMQFFRLAGPTTNCPPPVMTDSLGHYSAVLDTGRYIIRANPICEHMVGCYRPEYYDNCPEPSCATVVALAESSVFTANFGLSRPAPPTYAFISGTVNDTLNQPIRNARVSIMRTMQEMNFIGSLGIVPGRGSEEFDIPGVGHSRGVLWSGMTDSLGHYTARVIADHNYLAMASKPGFLPQYFDHKSSVQTADVIQLTGDTSGIDFNLAARPVPNNSVSGSVVDSTGAGVVSRVVLIPARFVHPAPSAMRYFHTDSLGNYSITGVGAGQYFVLALPFSNYAPAFYKLNGCGIIHIQDADTVNVDGNVTGINICVGGIHSNGLAVVRGTIRSSDNSVVAGARLTAFNAQGELAAIGISDVHGAYELNAVSAGLTTVVADREGFSSSQVVAAVPSNAYTLENVNIILSPTTPMSVGDPGVIPGHFALNQNYPNPFNPSTKITYALSAPGVVTLKVFNVLGQEVATLVNGNNAAGTFEVVWNGKDNLGRSVASGIYIYRMHASAGTTEFTQVRKMLMLK